MNSYMVQVAALHAVKEHALAQWRTFNVLYASPLPRRRQRRIRRPNWRMKRRLAGIKRRARARRRGR